MAGAPPSMRPIARRWEHAKQLAHARRGLIDDNNHLFPLAYKRRNESLWDRLQAATDPVFAPARAFCEDLLAHRHLPAFDFLSRALTTRREDGLSGWDRLIQRLGEPAVAAAVAIAVTVTVAVTSVAACSKSQQRVPRRAGEMLFLTVWLALGLVVRCSCNCS